MKGEIKWILTIVIVAVALLCIYKYNQIVKLDELVKDTWTPLSAQLQQRYDEIPKLVNEVILYTSNEDEQTRALAVAQKAFAAASGMKDKVTFANNTETALEQMLLQAGQRYPGIASHYQYMELNQGFQTTKQQLTGPMDVFNKAVEKYNTYTREFPNDIVSVLLGFESKYIYFKKEQD
ncbi:MAG: LemA family protein [bacterium]